MRTETTTRQLFTFDELSEQAKQKAIEKFYDINFDNTDWWEQIGEDAEQINAKITEFDIDRASYCKIKFEYSAADTAKQIIKEHGETCETYKTAAAYLADVDKLENNPPTYEDGETDERELDNLLDELGEDFKKSLQEGYLTILRKEYEYLSSREVIIETIEANNYEFLEDGTPA